MEKEVLHVFQDIPKRLVEIQGDWVSKTVTTNPPRYIPHHEFAWHGEVIAAQPILLVLLLKSNNRLFYQKFWRNAARLAVHVRLSFFPYDWNASNTVQISLYQSIDGQGGGVQLAMTDENLKRNPRQVVEIPIEKQTHVLTGTLLPVANINLAVPLYAQVIVINKDDTNATRGRWCLKESVAKTLPASLGFLQHGRCSGSLVLSEDYERSS